MDGYIDLAVSPNVVFRAAGAHTASYNTLYGGLCLLNDKALAFLRGIQSRPYRLQRELLYEENVSQEIELVQQLFARHILEEQGTAEILRSSENQSPNLINVIQLVLVNSCNFGCTYCFEGKQGADNNIGIDTELRLIESIQLNEDSPISVNRDSSIYSSKERLFHQQDKYNRLMAPEDAVTYLKKSLEMVKSSGSNFAMIQFFGGEPLLNKKAIYSVLEYLNTHQDVDIAFSLSIVTNGSLVDENIAKAFHDNGVSVCVSFDSVKSPSRPLKNGDSSAPLVYEGLELLRKYNNYIAINVALTSDTWEDVNVDVIEFAKMFSASEIGIVVDFDPTFYETHATEEIVTKILDIIEAGKKENIKITGYWHQIFQIMPEVNIASKRGFKNCSAKGAQLSIEPNGAVFSCKAGSGYYGSILSEMPLLESKTYKEHNSLRYDNPIECKGCEVEGFCAGMCLGPIQKKFGEVNRVETSACEFYRQITREQIAELTPYQIPTFELD